MPNKENLRKWVAALRSGEYEQTTGTLARRGKKGEDWRYCCLGVACEVAIKDGLDLAVEESTTFDSGITKGYDNRYEVPPEAVFDWLGIRRGVDWDVNDTVKLPHCLNPRNCEACCEKDFVRHLDAVDLNDDLHFSFEEIADRIEAEFDLAEG